MHTLTASLPWEFWFLWGIISILVLLKYAIWPRKNTPPVPFMWKIAWVLCMFAPVLVMATSYIDGTGIYKEYEHLVGQFTLPVVLLLFLTTIAGCYQISMRPDFDYKKRRTLHIQTIVIIVCLIILGYLMRPFILERYYK